MLSDILRDKTYFSAGTSKIKCRISSTLVTENLIITILLVLLKILVYSITHTVENYLKWCFNVWLIKWVHNTNDVWVKGVEFYLDNDPLKVPIGLWLITFLTLDCLPNTVHNRAIVAYQGHDHFVLDPWGFCSLSLCLTHLSGFIKQKRHCVSCRGLVLLVTIKLDILGDSAENLPWN